MENSSDANHLPVIVSVNGGYMEHDSAPEKPDFTQWVDISQLLLVMKLH